MMLYKISSGLSYVVLLLTAFYYTFYKPNEEHGPRHRFGQHQTTTLFAQSFLVTSSYGYVILTPHTE